MRVFISYSKQDENLFNDLFNHLETLKKNELISTWSMKEIVPGTDWDKESEIALQSADIILLLISPDYLSSDYIWEKHIKASLVRHQRKEAHIVPILLRPSLWYLTILAPLTPLPHNGKPIMGRYWRDYRDEALKEIAEGVLKVIYFLKNVDNKTQHSISEYDFDNSLTNHLNDLWNPKLLNQDLEKLTTNKIDIRSTLKGSPFDYSSDINGYLTKRIFYNLLYVEADGLTHIKNELKQTLDDIISTDSVIFLSGYSGNGKTTFIHTFIKDTAEYDHLYYDFQERMTNKSLGEKSLFRQYPGTSEVINLLHRKLRGDKRIIKTFEFLIKHRFQLKDYGVITYSLFKALNNFKKGKDIVDQKFIVECMESFYFKDSFTCFFIHIFLFSNSNKIKVIYFDNMDIISMEYITKSFLVAFEEALVNGNQLSRSSLFKNQKVDFTKKFRFVFCLREANNALINHHILDRIGLKRVNFKINFGALFYNNIIEKRILLIQKIFSNEELKRYKFSLYDLRKSISVLIEDRYFNKVFIPLYNYDYRDAMDALLNTIIKYKIYNKSWLSYGVRGVLLFGLIENMRIGNFLREYPQKYPNNEDGYCLIDRMVLTFLLNKCGYSRRIGRSEESKSFGLVDLVNNLKSYYSVDDILESIARCFLWHEKSWVHLITIFGINVTSEADFIKKFSKYINQEEGSFEKKLEEVENNLLEKDIQIKVNPAGFVYLRYIITHFEFYSILVKNQNPLFISSFKKEGNHFHFEKKINKVYNLAEEHIVNMQKFYNRKMVPQGLIPSKYILSDFCFKFFGREESSPRKKGFFHSTRIITSHIDYLDHFRRKTIMSSTNLPLSTKVNINRILILKIDQYLKLMKNSVDEKAKEDLLPHLKRCVLKIVRSEYKDFDTKVELKRQII